MIARMNVTNLLIIREIIPLSLDYSDESIR